MNTFVETSLRASRSRLGRSRVALLLSCVLLQGCGNVYEHVSQGKWVDVGSNETPTSAFGGDLDVIVVARGAGRQVRAGDLVRARVRVAKPTDPRLVAEPVVHDAWLWSGSSPSDAPRDDLDIWADLGSPRLRATLVGKFIGDRYSVRLAQNTQSSSHRLPLYGLAETASLDLQYHASLQPVLQVDGGYMEIEILDACAATLQRRTATVTQWGKAFNLLDSSHPTSRSGTLGWTALEADCAAPLGTVRFEIGPLYAKQHELLDWESSYRRASLEDSWLGLALRVLIGAACFALAWRWRARPSVGRRSSP